MESIVKYFEILSKHSMVSFQILALNQGIFVALTNKKL